MKNTKRLLISYLLIAFAVTSCKKDEDTPTPEPQFTVTDVNYSMMEKPADDTEIGTIDVTSQSSQTYTYSILSQSPDGALKIDVETGELVVADGSKFDHSSSPIITAVVNVTDGTDSEDINVTINLFTERDVLIDLYKTNPNSTLNWDTTSTDIGTWEGVTVTDGFVTRMIIYKKNITSIPKELGQFTQLSDLAFTDNPITSVPVELGQLVNLTKLSLLGGELTSIPKELSQLQKLETLSLNDNQLTNLPKELSELTNLKQLFVRINQLTSIPKELALLTNLEQMDLINNQLTSIPDEVCEAFDFDGVTFQKDDKAICSDNEFFEN